MSLAEATAAIEVRLAETRQEMVQVGRVLFDCGFHAALAGNLSARVGHDRIVCTAHGAHKGSLTPGGLLVCDLQSKVIEGKGSPTSELQMHLAAYRARPDVGAVIHAHPPTATSFAAASMPLDDLMLPEMFIYLGPVALVPYATPGTPALAGQLQPFFSGHDAFLLENHGALTLGRDLKQASLRMELIEQNARITMGVHQLGRRPFVLKPEQAAQLSELRKRLAAL